MGMDVYGVNPTSVKPEWFRRDIYQWYLIWRCCREVTPTAKQVECGFYNDGDGLVGPKHRQFVVELKTAIKDGTVKRYINYRQSNDSSVVSLAEMKKFLRFIDNNDGFQIW
jgi:hypothetical protein